MRMAGHQRSQNGKCLILAGTLGFLAACAPGAAHAQADPTALLRWLDTSRTTLGAALGTLGWTLGIIAIFIVLVFVRALVRLIWPMSRVHSALRTAMRQLQGEPALSIDQALRRTIEETERDEKRRHVSRRPRVSAEIACFYHDWRDNCVSGLGAVLRSTTAVENYIDLPRLVPPGFNWGASRVMPGVFTMLGIFGTFVGLTQGVTSLSIQFGRPNHEVSQLWEGVLGLMGGMGTAFWTSILGISLALLWMILDRRLTRTVDRAIHDLRLKLNELCPSLRDEGLARHLLEIGIEQKDGVKTLATDIATKVIEGFEESMLRTMVPALEDFNRAVGEAQAQGAEQVVERFGSLMGERLKQQFDNLATTLEQLCDWQKQSSQDLDGVLRRLSEAAQRQDAMIANSMQAVAVFQESMGELGRLHQSLATALEDFRTLGGEMNELRGAIEVSQRGVSESVQEMQESFSEMRESLGQTTRELGGVARKYTETLPQVTERMETLAAATARQAETLDERLRTSMEKFREDAAAGIQHTFSEFDKHLSLLTKALSGTIQETEEAVRQILGKVQQVSKTVDAVRATAEALQISAVTFANAMEGAVSASNAQAAPPAADQHPGEPEIGSS